MLRHCIILILRIGTLNCRQKAAKRFMNGTGKEEEGDTWVWGGVPVHNRSSNPEELQNVVRSLTGQVQSGVLVLARFTVFCEIWSKNNEGRIE